MSTKDFSNIQETQVAKYLGWHTVAGSGARDFHYGDIVDLEWLGECKTHMTPLKRITFYKKHWEKLSEEAVFHHKNPVLIVDNGIRDTKHTYCMFTYRFDTVDTLEESNKVIPIKYSGVNLNLAICNLVVATNLYSVEGFDSHMKVYICNIERFKDMMENG